MASFWSIFLVQLLESPLLIVLGLLVLIVVFVFRLVLVKRHSHGTRLRRMFRAHSQIIKEICGLLPYVVWITILFESSQYVD